MNLNQVVVGNLGTVYQGSDDDKAKEKYDTYVEQSKSMRGRAGGEDVTWFQGEQIREAFIGELNKEP